jgi:hypothetical protein
MCKNNFSHHSMLFFASAHPTFRIAGGCSQERVQQLVIICLATCRTREAEAVKKLEDHRRLGDDHKQRATAAAEEARALRARAQEARQGLEPHARSARSLLSTRSNCKPSPLLTMSCLVLQPCLQTRAGACVMAHVNGPFACDRGLSAGIWHKVPT